MESATKTRIWEFQHSLSQVQSALIEIGLTDIERSIREHVEVLRYFALLMDLPSVTTFTGAQGVGKSYHVNQMFGIPEPQRLVSGLGRGEKIPVFLMKRTPKAKFDVKLYKRDVPTGSSWFRFEELSYEEAREKVERPEDNDLCMFWHCKGNAVLDALAPVAVLPGFEYGTPWEKAIRIVLDLSDAVVYVTDQCRAAQDVSNAIEEKIGDLKLRTPPLVLLSKTDDMNMEQLEGFSTRFPYKAVPVGAVTSSGVPDGQEIIGSPGQYDELLQSLGEHFSGAQPFRSAEVLEDSVKKAMMYLKDARAELDRLETTSSAAIVRAIDSFVADQDELWDRVIRTRVLAQAKSVCEAAGSRAHEAVKPMIKDEFKKKIKVWWNGGVTLSFVNKMHRKMESEFTDEVSRLESGILGVLSKKSNEMTKKLLSGGVDSFDEVIETGRELILANAVTTPLKQIDQKMTTDLTAILGSGRQALEELGKTVKDAAGVAVSLEPVITAISKQKGRQKIFEEIRRLPEGERARTLKDLSIMGLGASGAAASGAEIARAGFAGKTMSVISGVLGGVIAGLAVGSWLMSVTRTANKTEFMVNDLALRSASAMSDQVRSDIEYRLDQFWECYKYKLQRSLLTETGLEQADKSVIRLAQSTHTALQEGADLIKALALASAD